MARHILDEIKLPSRFESLQAAIGPEVAALLVEPKSSTIRYFRQAADHIAKRGRGLFVPVYAESGAGKTTVASSLEIWLPRAYTTTIRYRNETVNQERLLNAVKEAVDSPDKRPDPNKIIVVNIDDRESNPPTDEELAQLKAFTREPTFGSRCLILWLETRKDLAQSTSDSYQTITSKSPVEIPLHLEGPEITTWQEIAVATLKEVNKLDRIEEIGINPADYDPNQFKTLGDYLDALSSNLVALLDNLREATSKPLRLIVCFASESPRSGVLEDLFSGAQNGMLSSDKLLSATPDSRIGRWWSDRRGALTSTLLRLDARAVAVGPTLSIPVIRAFGPKEATEILAAVGIKEKSPSNIATYLNRSILGKTLIGEAFSTAENRGNPAHDARAAFSLLSQDFRFANARDKTLNAAFAKFLQTQFPEWRISSESRVLDLPLIADVFILQEDIGIALEFHWRSGAYLEKVNRAKIASYILEKAKHYAVESGWVSG